MAYGKGTLDKKNKIPKKKKAMPKYKKKKK